MKTDGTLHPGRFWKLLTDLREGLVSELGVVTCCELGLEVDRLLPRPLPIIYQNGGGFSHEATSPLVKPIRQILIVHHFPCHFRQTSDPRTSLLQEWNSLRAGGPLEVHLWLLLGPGRELRILDPLSQELSTPLQRLPRSWQK